MTFLVIVLNYTPIRTLPFNENKNKNSIFSLGVCTYNLPPKLSPRSFEFSPWRCTFTPGYAYAK